MNVQKLRVRVGVDVAASLKVEEDTKLLAIYQVAVHGQAEAERAVCDMRLESGVSWVVLE